MPPPRPMPTGWCGTIGRDMAYLHATASCSTMSHPGAGRRLCHERSHADCLYLGWAAKEALPGESRGPPRLGVRPGVSGGDVADASAGGISGLGLWDERDPLGEGVRGGAFKYVNLDWQDHVANVDPRYLRPTEVPLLQANSSQAKRRLGWEPRVRFKELARDHVGCRFGGGWATGGNAPHGLAKKMLLVQGQAYRQQYGFNAVHLLPVNLYGPGGTDAIIPRHPGTDRKCLEAIERGEPEIVCWGWDADREFLYVEDCAEGLCLHERRLG